MAARPQLWPVLLLVGSICVPRPLQAQSNRDGPAYPLLDQMIKHLHASEPSETMLGPLGILAPFLSALEGHYQQKLLEPMKLAVERHDRLGALMTLQLAVLLDSQSWAERIEPDELSGWGEAMIKLRKSFVSYELLSREIALRQRGRDERTRAAFRALARVLSTADLTTRLDQIEPLRAQLVAELIAVREVITTTEAKGR